MHILRVGLLSTLIVVIGATLGSGQPKFPGVFVVPHDYKEISAAVEAAYKAGGGTVVVLDRDEGAYSGFSVGGDEQANAGKSIRILGVGASVEGRVEILCRMRVEIVGLTIYGDVNACASVAPLGGVPLEGPAGALMLRSSSIYGTVRVWSVLAEGYELEMTDNTISGGAKGGVFIDLPFGVGAFDFRYLLKNNRILSSQGNGLRLVLTPKASAKLEGNEIMGNAGHGLVLEFQGDQAAPVELVGNVISGNGSCGIAVNERALQIGAQLKGQANPIWDPLCPDPSSSEQAAKLFTQALRSGEVRRVCPQGCPFKQIQDALKNSQRGDVIIVEPGLYPEQLRLSGSLIIRMGRPAITSALRTDQAGRVVLSGEGREGPGIIIERGATVMLEGVTLQGFHDRCIRKRRDYCADVDSGDGLRVRSGARVLLRDVELVGNDDNGLEAEPGAVIYLQRVRMTNNRFGLFLQRGAQAQLDQTQIERNRSTGILLAARSQLVLRRSMVIDNGGRGLTLRGGAQLYLAESRIEGNGSCGLRIIDGPPARITGTSRFVANGAADLCGPVPKEIRLPLAEPTQTQIELSCPQVDPASLQQAIDSLQPGGRLRLKGRCSSLSGAVIDKPVIIEGSGPEQSILQGFISVLSGGQLSLQRVRTTGVVLVSGVETGGQLQAQQSTLDFVLAESGAVTIAESQLSEVLRLAGLFAPVRAQLRANQIQGDLEFLAIEQPVEAEVTQNRLKGGIVGIWTVGVPPVAVKLRAQGNEIVDYLQGVLLEGLSEVVLEGNAIKDNWLGIGISIPGCPRLTELFFSGKLEGRGNTLSGNDHDFCPPWLGLRLR